MLCRSRCRTRGRTPSWSPPEEGPIKAASRVLPQGPPTIIRDSLNLPQNPGTCRIVHIHPPLVLGVEPGQVLGVYLRPQWFGTWAAVRKGSGIPLALDFVEQSRAAAVKAAERMGASSACCLNGLDRSCPESSDQSMGSTLQSKRLC